MSSPNTVLALSHAAKSFGGICAIRDVSFEVEQKQIFGLIGPNGAGKTTLLNLVTGVYQPDSGSIRFLGSDIHAHSPVQIATLGIARTFQNIRLFRSLSVEQNVTVAGYHARSSGAFGALYRSAATRRDEQRLKQRALELLELMNLLPLRSELAGALPYGSQRRLEIARALMLDPKLILLDEPAAGMNSQESLELNQQIRFLRDELDLSVVLVEHNMSVVMRVCDTIHVVDHGETIAHGTPEEIRAHPEVLRAYLGQSLRPPRQDQAGAPAEVESEP